MIPFCSYLYPRKYLCCGFLCPYSDDFIFHVKKSKKYCPVSGHIHILKNILKRMVIHLFVGILTKTYLLVCYSKLSH